MCFIVLCILARKYLKSSTILRAVPPMVLRGVCCPTLIVVYSVFLASRCSPIFLDSVSTLLSYSCALLIWSDNRAMLPAKPRSVWAIVPTRHDFVVLWQIPTLRYPSELFSMHIQQQMMSSDFDAVMVCGTQCTIRRCTIYTVL